MSVTKRDLVVEVSEGIRRRLTQEEVLEILQLAFDRIVDHLAKGETVELRNFGVFEVRYRRARIGRNPNEPHRDVRIPPRAVVRFKPGKYMREMVSERLSGPSAD